jgi:hypothetical protein
MLSHLAAYGFELPARFVGLLQFEQRYAQRKSRAHHQRGIEVQSRPEFRNGRVVAVLPQRIVTLAQM